MEAARIAADRNLGSPERAARVPDVYCEKVRDAVFDWSRAHPRKQDTAEQFDAHIVEQYLARPFLLCGSKGGGRHRSTRAEATDCAELAQRSRNPCSEVNILFAELSEQIYKQQVLIPRRVCILQRHCPRLPEHKLQMAGVALGQPEEAESHR